MEQAQKRLHPDEAAQQMRGCDEGMIEETDVAAGAEDDAGSGERRAYICEWAGSGQDELPGAAAGDFLALRIGVGEQAADGEKENGAQAQAEPRGNQEARGFANDDCRDEDEKEGEAARPSAGATHGEQHEYEQREEDVDAELNTHPAAQRD